MSSFEEDAPPPIAVQTVEMPQGGGGIQGIGEHLGQDDYTGQFSFSVPLRCSPCRAGGEPSLQLVYRSFSGHGLFGIGFDVPIASIARQTSRRVPRYDDSDVFVHAGDQLRPLDLGPDTRTVAGVAYAVQAFQPRVERAFDRIERWSAAPGEVFWRVLERGGRIAVYGRTEQARVVDPADPTHIAEWLLEYLIDPRGDVRCHTYKQEDLAGVPPALQHGRVVGAERHPERVCYGNDVAYTALDGGVTPPPAQSWHFELVFDYGEYEVDPRNDGLYTPVRAWPCRSDPLSNHKYGFERRTYRLCRNVLMFHRFAEELSPQPVLVHALSLAYDEDPAATRLASCQLVGYRWYGKLPAGERYVTRATPALTLTYTGFDPSTSTDAKLLLDDAGEPIEGFAESASLTVADLYGEGAPGLLYADGDCVHYRSPVLQDADAQATWSQRQQLDSFPLERNASERGMLLSDLEGDGVLDLVKIDGGVNGFYRSRRERGWEGFASFAYGFTDFWNPAYARADLDGDGRAEVVWKTPESVGYFASAGEQGFAPAQVIPAAPGMPPAFADGEDRSQLLTFADVLAGGTPCLVRVTDGLVECWPSLGYGRFGAVVQMVGTRPCGEQFDSSRVLFADIDGSGAPALVYAHADCVEIFRNLAGNAFAATPICVPLPAPYSSPEQLRFEDVYGAGYECLLFSTLDPAPQTWCIDLCDARKPYLLQTLDNGEGARTLVDYQSSARCRLLDASEGIDWVTHVPFPVQLVARVVSVDDVAGTQTEITYRYRHGHYDSVEREFRGFAMIEQTLVETATLEGGNGVREARSFAPPKLVRSWYHTGAWHSQETLQAVCRGEYWDDDEKAWPYLQSSFACETPPAPETARQGAIALAGRELRRELYGLDGSCAQGMPHEVREQSHAVQVLEEPAPEGFGAFFVHEAEAVQAHYERQREDPLVHQYFVLAIDAFGEIELECTVACPRRPGAPDPAGGQAAARIVAGRRSWQAITDQPDIWLLAVPAEHQTLQVLEAAPPDLQGLYYSKEAIADQVSAAIATCPFGAGGQVDLAGVASAADSSELTAGSVASGSPSASILTWYRYTYVPDEGSGRPLTPQALLVRRAEAVFADSLVASTFAGQRLPCPLGQFLQAHCGYVLDAHGCWWNPMLSEQYAPLAGFYRPQSTTDPIALSKSGGSGSIVEYAYDEHGLLLERATVSTSAGDVLPSTLTATRRDYVALAACQIEDENGVVHEALRDPLGTVASASSYGEEWRPQGAQRVGFAPLDFDAPPPTPATAAELMASPDQYLRGAAQYVYCDLEAWRAGRGPTCEVVLVATEYPEGGSELPRGAVQVALSHHDGGARPIRHVQLAEPPGEHGGQLRYRVSATTLYNASSLACLEWQPYFCDSYEWSGWPAPEQASLLTASYYDALDRAVRVESPAGALPEAFLDRREILPWSVASWDRNDTVEESRYYAYYVQEGHGGLDRWDREALTKATAASDTPEVQASDNLGFRSAVRRLQQVGGEPEVETFEADMQGNELWAADARLGQAGIHNIERVYGMDRQVLKATSVDAGTRWLLRNAMGELVYLGDSRGFAQLTSYDGLQRPTQLSVSGGDGEQPLNDQVLEHRIYADSLDSTGKPPLEDPASRNLMGQEWHRYDSSGLLVQDNFTITRQPYARTTWMRADYATEADWSVSGPGDWSSVVAQLAVKLAGSDAQQFTMRYDALGRTLVAVDPAGNAQAKTYHVSGMPDTLTLTPSGGQPRTYVAGSEYDAANRPLLVAFADANSVPVIATGYSYDAQTARVRQATTTRLADKAVLQDLTYHFDPVGNLTHVEDGAVQGPAVPADRDHTFDALYRLTRASGRAITGYTEASERSGDYSPFGASLEQLAAEPYTCSYEYDRGENLTEQRYTAANANWVTQLDVAERSNRATRAGSVPPDSSGAFDANGNALAIDGLDELRWNYANQLCSVACGDETEHMLYDIYGNRIARIVESGGGNGLPAVVEQTLYLGSIERYRRTVAGVLDTAFDRLRLLGVDGNGGCALSFTSGSPPSASCTSWFTLKDVLDSATLDVDESGQLRRLEEYLPFGGTALAASTDGEPDLSLKTRRHAARERDPVSGLYHYGLRYHACWLGRWTSPDPALDLDGLNLYAFVRNNPVTYADVFGLCSKKKGARTSSQAELDAAPRAVKHEKVDFFGSSKLRFLRRVQAAYGGSRNIAVIKFKRKGASGAGPKVLYLIARSMGQGHEKLRLAHEHVVTKAGTPKRRSHSEALLRAALEVGKVRVGSGAGRTTYNLKDYKPAYVASTNEACGEHHENCVHESVPYLGVRIYYFANDYAGTEQAQGMEKLYTAWAKAVRGGAESESESEGEGEAVALEETQFRGLDLGDERVEFLLGERLTDVIEHGGKGRKRVYEASDRQIRINS